MPVTSQRKLTYADFLLFPDDGKRHEIIDGVHCVTPCPNFSHQELLGRLHLALGNFLATRRALGRVVLSPFDVVMSNHDVVEPDLLFIAGDQQAIITDANVQGPPALVIEILSPSTRRRDVGIKRALFDRSGVREYWLVDPAGSVTVCRRAADGTFPTVATLTRVDAHVLTTPLLPDFSLSMADLFAEA
jgi:Uma2 family endonuclease